MSFLRSCFQRISRQISETLPTRFRYVNADIIDKYQRIHDATIDTYRQRFETDSRNVEKFQTLRKLVHLLRFPVSTGGNTSVKYNTQEGILTDMKYNKENSDENDDESVIDDIPIDNDDEMKSGNIVDLSHSTETINENNLITYENNLRNFSSPEKIFRYFASICLVLTKGTEILMTPIDFLHSICPGSKNTHPDFDGFLRINELTAIDDLLHLPLNGDSIFLKLGHNGLIKFADYLFLMTILSTSSRHFEIAFQMYDINRHNALNVEEFEAVIILARQSASFAANGHDSYRRGVPKALLKYFFGSDLKGKLNIHRFLKFQKDLKREILELEFDTKPCDPYGRITETDFADLIIAYAGFKPKEVDERLRRVSKRFKRNQRGITKKEYIDFWDLLNNLNDVEMALSFYQLAGASIDKETLHYVSKTVVKVSLSEHAVDVAFTVFDDINTNDDQVSNQEFVDAVKHRLNKGLQWKLGSNFGEIVQALKRCAFERRSYDI